MLMNTLRKAAVAIAAPLLVLLLLGFGFAWSVHQAFGNPEHIKTAVRTSGIYQTGIGEVLDQAQKQQPKAGESDSIPITNTDVRAVVIQSFPPSELQAQTEGVIDSAYNWVTGKTPTLQFSFNLAEPKQKLADGLSQYINQHLSSLPVCAANQIPSGEVNPFNATCLPPGTDVASIATKTHDNILMGDFLKDPSITQDTIKNNNGKALDQQLQTVPQSYHRSILAMYGGGVLALGLIAVVIFASSSWRRGLRRVAIMAISVGAFAAIIGWLGSFVVHRIALKIADQQTVNQPLQLQLIHIVQSLANEFRMRLMSYGIALVVLGIISLVVVILTRSKGITKPAAPQTKPSEQLSVPNDVIETTQPEPRKPAEPRPRKKIQL